ncbi:MAG: DUF4296 domain-containing protein [Calditrichaeota bacterium]|nr:DUF4296 domain-containing protein [Calditrichota bacterium]
MRYFIILTMLLTLFSCRKKDEKLPSQQLDKFVETFKSYIIIAASDTAKFENRSAYLDSALAKNKYTRQEFDSVMKYIGKNPNEIEKFVNQFGDSLKAITKRASGKNSK